MSRARPLPKTAPTTNSKLPCRAARDARPGARPRPHQRHLRAPGAIKTLIRNSPGSPARSPIRHRRQDQQRSCAQPSACHRRTSTAPIGKDAWFRASVSSGPGRFVARSRHTSPPKKPSSRPGPRRLASPATEPVRPAPPRPRAPAPPRAPRMRPACDTPRERQQRHSGGSVMPAAPLLSTL